MSAAPFRVEKSGFVATLWLSNPARRNAMGPEFFDELPKVVRGLDEDEGVRAVVLAAEGEHFSSGLDLMRMAPALGPALLEGGLAKERHALLQTIDRMRSGFDAIAASQKPFVAAVQGACIGGGLDLIAACDVRFCAESAKFSLRETKIAIVADMGSLQRLAGVIPDGALREMALTGGDISARRAEKFGLVNDVLPSQEETLERARAMAAEIADNSPLVVMGTKEVLRVSREQGAAHGLRYVALWNAAHLASHDLREALGAFMEKRKPVYSGS